MSFINELSPEEYEEYKEGYLQDVRDLGYPEHYIDRFRQELEISDSREIVYQNRLEDFYGYLCKIELITEERKVQLIDELYHGETNEKSSELLKKIQTNSWGSAMEVIITIPADNMQDAEYTMQVINELLENARLLAGIMKMSVSDKGYDHSAHVCSTCHCPPSQHIKNVPGTSNGKPYCMHHQRQCHDMKVVSGL